MNKAERLKVALEEAKPDSQLALQNSADVAKVVELYPNFPAELTDLYTIVGTGRIGSSSYSIHFPPSDPEDIYDSATAKELNGIIIVGDDFAGNCEAYNTNGGWRFGTIGSDCRFEPYDEFKSLTDFLLDWFEPKREVEPSR